MEDKKEVSLEEIKALQEKPKSALSEEAEEMLAISRILAKLAG